MEKWDSRETSPGKKRKTSSVRLLNSHSCQWFPSMLTCCLDEFSTMSVPTAVTPLRTATERHSQLSEHGASRCCWPPAFTCWCLPSSRCFTAHDVYYTMFEPPFLKWRWQREGHRTQQVMRSRVPSSAETDAKSAVPKIEPAADTMHLPGWLSFN